MSVCCNAVAPVALPSRICVSIGHANAEKLLQLAHAEAVRGETFFEFCLEFLSDPCTGPVVVREFVHRWPDTCVIATCRKDERCFHGSVEEQLAILSAAVESGARCIDLEIETAAHTQSWLREMGRHCLRIVSYHNYDAAPPLKPILQTLESVPADIVKIAVSTRDPETLCSLIHQARQYPRPSLFLAMGASGFPTRILGPVAGRSFTYACPQSAEATAAGQVDVQTLREVYRLDEADAATSFIAGFPDNSVGSPDPITYNRILATTHCIYVPWPAAREIPASLLYDEGPSIGGMALGHQLSHDAFRLADVIENEAHNAGIVDTLWRNQGKWHAGWKLGESIVNLLRLKVGCGAHVAVIAANEWQREATTKLLVNHGYCVSPGSHAECCLIFTHTSVGFSSQCINKDDMYREMIRRQVDCWLAESRKAMTFVAV